MEATDSCLSLWRAGDTTTGYRMVKDAMDTFPKVAFVLYFKLHLVGNYNVVRQGHPGFENLAALLAWPIFTVNMHGFNMDLQSFLS